MKRRVINGLVLVQVQYVIRTHQAGGEVVVGTANVDVPLGGKLCCGPEVPDHTSGVAVIGPGVQLQKVGDEHGADIRHGTATRGIHCLGVRMIGWHAILNAVRQSMHSALYQNVSLRGTTFSTITTRDFFFFFLEGVVLSSVQ